ncbi:phosphatidylinositol 4,5-bisphosphate 5-phosphatase A-like isoform X2 [Anopheles albimanus]|uniref:phosphatidylinositol 4,5-bisphosphate 5-phosphatase A-like isoform X2 n=1 Tax=Anopheles albimanus TaxID=7167 RepID=UPI0016414ED8|nr:phosphatidylinositol 4,5-bisphosphate 5-phosphatase A-like isoform X2 [Anopheles albimanus]XP_035785306.1 phosphatidylinositol 4,5-bisphosphate 5-phosphatase A-like isoform X2 [Anopheles albimanus]XP_035785307.1 phosphatidylinositol 4,5-bisphosphate 5-phosphatase A-like isoform X2 [Anopheles albimanus]XP_035785308.1 phosphatidylinositol 4,5-bisphosphate 5-phosphatase A-like isoform X2 [Anopheles albimanus]XP_035785309.1 phosphatidylinositol 4,5-bisphosphate 5-phosphatase A-like isoform X2 [A
MSQCDNNWNVNLLCHLILRIYVVTWNVSTKFPENISLHKLLGLESSPDQDTHLPDFFVIGLQEVNAQPQNTLYNLFKDDLWTQKFKDILKERDYVVIKTEQMQGLLLSVFARRKHLLHLRQVETEYTRTGLGGIWGNKGAVSIRMNIYGSSICLVNAHLAAHDHMLEERINDYERIVQEQKFHVKAKETIFDHDYVFWFGDLNFRLTGEATTSPDEIRAMVARDELKQLIERDQLLLVRREGRAFQKLQERLPQFPPTFKFEHGSNEYDMKRRPAWTDRILYAVNENNYRNVRLTVEQTSYKSHPSYNISDHKPVTSEFTLKCALKLSNNDTNGNPYPTRRKTIRRKKRQPVSMNQSDAAAKTNAASSEAKERIVRKSRYNSEQLRREFNNRLSYKLAMANNSDLHSFDGIVADLVDATERQIYEDESERTVSFKPVDLWHVGEPNTIEYVIPSGFEEGNADWIGIYRENFTSLNEYLAYEYTETYKDKQHQLNEQQMQHLQNTRTVRLTFSENVSLPLGERYQLLYFQSTGTRGVTGLVGISSPFAVEKRCPSPTFDDID